ncbi:MAG: YdeI/OmpD-associated family protein, partial [Cytophagales bacterium]|nr:YdeI/OmpD-associated family protein [Cytophagales bacterium]
MQHVTPASRAEWRQWLAENHAAETGVWLVYYKKGTGRPSVTYDEAVEEALCFGWIDSVPNKMDDERYKQLFSPRKPRSGWSRVNKERLERLTAAGLMASAGLAAIETAKQNGSWTKLDAVENLEMPDDLQTAFAAADAVALEHFTAFARSTKRGILEWL